jgi:hypothetical protein
MVFGHKLLTLYRQLRIGTPESFMMNNMLWQGQRGNVGMEKGQKLVSPVARLPDISVLKRNGSANELCNHEVSSMFVHNRVKQCVLVTASWCSTVFPQSRIVHVGMKKTPPNPLLPLSYLGLASHTLCGDWQAVPLNYLQGLEDQSNAYFLYLPEAHFLLHHDKDNSRTAIAPQTLFLGKPPMSWSPRT